MGPLSLLTFPLSTAWAVDWRPVSPGELQQKTPKGEPNPDAEVLFWDVKIEDHYSGGGFLMTLNNYLRVKVFTGRGKEKFSTVEIEH